MAKVTVRKPLPGERLFEDGRGVIFVGAGRAPTLPAAAAPNGKSSKASPEQAKANYRAAQARIAAMSPAELEELDRLEDEAFRVLVPAGSTASPESPPLDLQNLPFDPAAELERSIRERSPELFTSEERKAGKVE
jgi:hypothetical protein